LISIRFGVLVLEPRAIRCVPSLPSTEFTSIPERRDLRVTVPAGVWAMLLTLVFPIGVVAAGRIVFVRFSIWIFSRFRIDRSARIVFAVERILVRHRV
jgi:hypothetical protein